MKSPPRLSVLAALAVLAVTAGAPGGFASAAPGLIERGVYLTAGAGQCADCHRNGLRGGPNFIPGPPGAPWAKTVPSLRGLTMFKTDAQAALFLRTGKLPNGHAARRPMPRYRFNAADAEAIVAYLRSLK